MKATLLALSVLLILTAAPGTSAQTEISLSDITNVTHDSVLSGDLPHTITIHYDLSGAPPGRSYLTANAWMIFSPDGADWKFVQGSMLPAFSGLDWDYRFVNHFNKAGGSGSYGMPQATGGGNVSGFDTVAILFAGINADPGGGLYGGFNDFVFNIEFGSRREDAGLHICIDTCKSVPGGAWEWAHPDGLIEPDWSGRQCWMIGCCVGQVGDVNGVGGDNPTIGDVSMLINFLFIAGDVPDCLEESDINLSGTLLKPPLDWADVTIGDISVLIDYLFINRPQLPDCP